MRRIAVIGTAVVIMVILVTAGIASAQSFPGSDQYGTTPPPADIGAFVVALITAIRRRIFRLLARIFGRFARLFG